MKIWYSYFRKVVLWCAAFGFYFVTLYLLFTNFDVPRPLRITMGLLCGMLITQTYLMWLDSWERFRHRK